MNSLGQQTSRLAGEPCALDSAGLTAASVGKNGCLMSVFALLGQDVVVTSCMRMCDVCISSSMSAGMHTPQSVCRGQKIPQMCHSSFYPAPAIQALFVVPCCVRSWLLNFQGFACLCSPSHCRNTGSADVPVARRMSVLGTWAQIPTLAQSAPHALSLLPKPCDLFLRSRRDIGW